MNVFRSGIASLVLLAGCAGPCYAPSADLPVGSKMDARATSITPVSAPSVFGAQAASVTTSTNIPSEDSGAEALAVNDARWLMAVSGTLEQQETVAAIPKSLQGLAKTDSASSGAATVSGSATPAATPKPRVVKPTPRPAKQPINDATKLMAISSVLEQARARRVDAQKAFCNQFAQYCNEGALFEQMLKSESWAKSPDTRGAVYRARRFSNTFTPPNTNERWTRIAYVFRVVAASGNHHLIHGISQIEDNDSKGATKSIKWETSLQSDGSYEQAFHHAVTDAQGYVWIADWTKTEKPDGQVVGTGTFTKTDASGVQLWSRGLAVSGTVAQELISAQLAPGPSNAP